MHGPEASRLIDKVVSEDRTSKRETVPSRSTKIGRLAAAYAERGDVNDLLRMLTLDLGSIAASPNAIDHALPALQTL